MDQKRYIDFMDMFDGGGAGKMGDTFQGGGLFSLIANMVADPYGSKDPERRKERMKALGLLDTGMDMSTPPAAPTVAPVVQPTVRTGPAPSYANMDMGEAGRGSTPAPTANPIADMPAMDFMDVLRRRAPTDPQVPFGGYQQPSPYSDMIARLKEMGIDANNMPAEQLQQLMLMYSRGGPFAYGRGM